MIKSRIEYATKNFLWATVGNIFNLLLNFISRTVFIYTLGTVYLGINGLFTNILGMLSLAELGVGAAISFSLYKPLAENNIKQIQAIINFYRTAYRVIAGIIMIIGIIIIPFLKYIVNGADGIEHLLFIYSIFIFNTVTSYLLTYKTTLLSADQRNYLITNINTVINVITTIAQIVVIVIFKDFIIYLIIGAIIQFVSKLYMNAYTNKMYPYIKGKNDEHLSKKDKDMIFTKIKALIFHKVGEISIYQTDNIITSAFISVNAVGLVSNFVMIINSVNNFIMAFFNSATAGLGNIIATEGKEKRLVIAKRYDFLGFVFFGCSTICLYYLMPPLIEIWLGSDKLIDGITIALLCLNYYLTGIRVPLSNIKAAAGVYEQDQWVPIVQSIVNIIASVIGAKYLGLKGIYIGTLVSSMIPNIVRPYIVYKNVFFVSSREYFLKYFFRMFLMFCCICLIQITFYFINIKNIYLLFSVKLIISALVPIGLIILIYKNTDEYRYVKNIIISLKNKIIRK